jgi:hypothetical protein
MDTVIGWYAAISGMVAALMIASDLGRRVVGWGFALFVTSSIAWITAGLVADESSILWQNVVLFGTNVLGVYRWLWRRKPQAVAPG